MSGTRASLHGRARHHERDERSLAGAACLKGAVGVLPNEGGASPRPYVSASVDSLSHSRSARQKPAVTDVSAE